MEGNSGASGGSGSAAPPWDLAMHWAPTAGGSSYPPQPLAQRPGGVPSQLHMLHHHSQQQQQQQELTCLKLGKRPACCWAGAAAGNQQLVAQAAGAGLPPAQVVNGSNGGAAAAVGGGSGTAAAEGKRKEKAAAPGAPAAVPRCQVEGCHVALADAKDYHKRHKVCEAHSKAPRVVVLGAEQRFCQQCSRFHAISEFDDAKRSCRRRLAGHNERRRKSNASEAMARGVAHPHGVTAFGHGFLPPCGGGLRGTPAGALSLLSSARGGAASGGGPWLVTTPDISARSSAALDDLIAENRAALLAWQYFSADRSSAPGARHFASSSTAAGCALPPPADLQAASSWRPHHPHGGVGVGGGRYHVAAPGAWHATLDLMQTASSVAPASTGAPLRPVPERASARPRGKTKDGDASGCSVDAWAPAGGARVL